jgi:hypothetical protein
MKFLLSFLFFAYPAFANRSVFEIKNGDVFSQSQGKFLTKTQGKVMSFTTSPDQTHLVYVVRAENKIAMYIQKLRAGTEALRVGSTEECCLIMTKEAALKRGHSEQTLTSKAINGGLWTSTNQLMVESVSKKYEGIEFLLSMDGKLVGDI